MAIRIILTKESEQNIVNLYQSGISSIKIGKQLSYSPGFVNSILKQNNIQMRKYHEINKKYDINENYFDNIDSEEKAYFLGFLFSDGNVNSKSNAITLKLQKRDEEILLKLGKLIGKTSLYSSENNYVLKFSSHNMKNKLIEIGCMPNKTFKLKFPNINENLYNHFIRGYFDGDGSIVKYKNDRSISMISTKDFCEYIKNTISNKFNIIGKVYQNKASIARENSITSILSYTGNRRVEKILDWLYKDSIIHLDRKYKKYLELKEHLYKIDLKTDKYTKDGSIYKY